MSKSGTSSVKRTLPQCPFLFIEILDMLGTWRGNIDDAGLKETNETIAWFSKSISQWAGIPEWKTFVLIARLADGTGLDGDAETVAEVHANRREMGVYGGYLDLNSVTARLHELDTDGTTAKLWRRAYRTWPLIRRFYDIYREVRLDRSARGDGRAAVVANGKGRAESVDGLSLATALIVQAIERNGSLPDGTKLNATELHRRLVNAGIPVTRPALYGNKGYERVRNLGRGLGMFRERPSKLSPRGRVPHGSKDKNTGILEAVDYREGPPNTTIH